MNYTREEVTDHCCVHQSQVVYCSHLSHSKELSIWVRWPSLNTAWVGSIFLKHTAVEMKVPFRVEGGHHLQGVASDPDTTLRFRSSVNGVNACTYVE